MEFINPYNFIALSDKPVRQKMNQIKLEEQGDLLYGSICYSLKTRSPLFIPNTSGDCKIMCDPEPNKDIELKEEHLVQDFFSYMDLSGKDYAFLKNKENLQPPVIPGSEVRGMFRTIYETLTNSCMSTVNEKELISRRSAERFLPGILKKQGNTVVLYKAEDIPFRNSEDFREKKNETCSIPDCSLVSFKRVQVEVGKDKADDVRKEENSDEIETGRETGFLLKGTSGPDMKAKKADRCNRRNCVNYKKPCKGAWNSEVEHCYLAEKHCAHIFVLKDKLGISNADRLESMLDTVLKAYNKEAEQAGADKSKRDYHEYRNAFDLFTKGEKDSIPVYYSRFDDNAVMVSPACITREVYETSPVKLMKGYRKCGHKDLSASDWNGLCPACRLFGMIGSVGEQTARGSRIRFADLHLVNQNNLEEVYESELVTLEELSSPKPANAEFYLRCAISGLDDNEMIAFWTYDYYVVKNVETGQVKVCRFKDNELHISGRKFYWHFKRAPKANVLKTKRNKTVRLVKENVSFEGEIYFDGITRKQLDQILFILRYTEDGKFGYKLGGGKPIGLGSVQICDTRVRLRAFNQGGYGIVPDTAPAKNYSDLCFDSKIERVFNFACTFDPLLNQKVSYPKVDGKEEIYEWFTANKANYAFAKINGKTNRNYVTDGLTGSPSSRVQAQYIEVLPDAMSAAEKEGQEQLDEIRMGVEKSQDFRLAVGKAKEETSDIMSMEDVLNVQNDVFHAKVISKGKKSGKGKQYLFEIEVAELGKKKGTVISKNQNQFRIGQEIEVYRENRNDMKFNVK